MKIWLDVQQAGVTTGPGPVVEITAFSSRTRLNQAGDWRATVPALDERAVTLLQPLRTVLAYAMVDGVKTFLGGGTIEALQVRIRTEAPMLEISGRDLIEELNRSTVGDVVVQHPSAFDLADYVIANVPAAWATGPILGDVPDFVARFVYDTFLGSLTGLAEKLPFWFRMAGARQIAFFGGALPTTATVRCLGNVDALAAERNADICLITEIAEERQAAEVTTRVIAFGAGNGDARLSLALATLWPDGTAITTPTVIDGDTYSYNPLTNTITNATAEGVYGRIERALAWKDVAPVSNSDADLRAAANMLAVAVCEHLRRHRDPAYMYSLQVVGLRASVLPGDLVRVAIRRVHDGKTPISIDRDLRVLEVATTVDAAGVRVTGLTVATVDTWPATDTEMLVREIRQSQVMEALPQAGPSVDTISYREPIDDDVSAELRFWLGNETTTVNQVLVRFRVDPFRSTTKTVGGTVSGTVDIPDHSHSVTIPAHDHDIPDHQHRLEIIGNGTGALTYQIGFGAGGTSGGVRHNIDNNDWDWVTNADSGSTTSEEGGGSTETATDGGAQTGLDLDISAALSLEYGIYEDSSANTYAASDLAWLVNGATASGAPVATDGGWYELDVTADVVAIDGIRPGRPDNVITVLVAPASAVGKRAMVTAQIERRTVIQAIQYI